MSVDISQLEEKARAARLLALHMVESAQMGHIGSDFSCIDVLTVLYHHILRIDPETPRAPGRDRFILSKGHASGALYALLCARGFLPKDELASYMQPEGRLSGHPERVKIPGVEASTGPLGHGLPIAVGIAIAAKLSNASYRTYVLTGDGELQEGSNWEAAMCAAHRGLDNLCWIVDRNRLQQGDRTESTNALDSLEKKAEAFGFEVTCVDAHDLSVLVEVFESLPRAPGKPTCVITNSIKGRGVSFMEDNVAWHHRVPTPEEFVAAYAELGVSREASK
jgi:transketolase